MKESNICDIVKNIVEINLGGDAFSNVEYKHGEMDVLHIASDGCRTYYEIKTSSKEKHTKRGIRQIERAIKYGMCDQGYVVTPYGWKQVR